MPMMTLGGYVFELTTAAYQRLKRSDEYRWAAMMRLTVDPLHQWIGPGLATIDLDGTIYGGHALGGTNPGTFQIEAMRAEARQGTPLPLVDGRGVYYGLWCILEVGEVASTFADHGGPRRQDFTVKLTRQGEWAGGGGAGGGAAGGGALADQFGGDLGGGPIP